MDWSSIITIVSGIVIISASVTGMAVYALRTATTDMKRLIDQSTTHMQQEFKQFTKGVDAKLDNFHIHVDQKVEGVKTHVRDVSLKSDDLSERIHAAERDYLIFRSDLSEKFVTKSELDDLRKRIVRLEPGSS